MAQRKQKKGTAASRQTQKHLSEQRKRTAKKRPIRREVGAIVCLLLGAATLSSCFGVDTAPLNWLSLAFKGFIGSGYYILPFSFLMGFLILMFHDGRPVVLRTVCAFLLPVTVGAMVHLIGGQESVGAEDFVRTIFDKGMHLTSGGLISGSLAQILEQFPGAIISVILLLICLLLELITTLNMTVGGIIKAIKNRPRVEYDAPKREHRDPAEKIVERVSQVQQAQVERRRAKASDFDIPVDDDLPDPQPKRAKRTQVQEPADAAEEHEAEHKERMESLLEEFESIEPAGKKMPPLVIESPKAEQPPLVIPSEPAAPEQPEKIKKEEVRQEAAKIAEEISVQEQKPAYQFPPLDLLNAGSGASVNGTEEMRQNAQRLSDTLASFSIEAQIINVTRGPTVTRYELELNRGVRLNRVTNLADDIALSLGASGVRIAAIPDKISVVGIEVPNRAVSTVLARDVLESQAFAKSKSKISFAVGKDIGGSQIVGDISKLPHMLIAGTTGSGKSVCMNSLIISLLYKAKPDEVKLIMVDPKMVELGIYNGIPHLLIPVVTDPKKAAGALQWAVTEMMRRYRLMADLEVHDLKSYNDAVKKSDTLEPMPQIVVVIDELADLMLVAAKEVEESICRIAQMGRASGIHLVIATQRPSADVITGLMKANIPSRIAFAVASAMESRIILDSAGAEKLVGKGDMLYAPLGEGKPKRVQGCFITDEEVRRVVSFIKQGEQAQYSKEVMDEIERKAEQQGSKGAPASESVDAPTDSGDEMTPAAVEVILETGQASVSMLQRRLKLGYARAARIMDELEEKGIVGQYEGSKPRQLLITREQWERMKDGGAEEFNQAVEEEIP